MRRSVLLTAMSLWAMCGCSSPVPVNDGGTDGGDQPIEIDVSGVVLVHPDGLALLADAGQSFTVAGLTVRVEEPLKVALNDPAGVFSTATLTSAATFSANKVPQDLINTGLAVGVRDDSDAGTSRVVRSATVIYDVALEAGKPTANITGAKAYAVPALLHDKLNQAVGLTKLHELATALPDAGTLVEAGFILGKVVDAQNRPVAGVTIAPLDSSKAERFLYPAADFASTGAATSSNGLFLYVHTGGDVQPPFRFNVAGATGYKQRSAGAASAACLVMTVYPGTTVP